MASRHPLLMKHCPSWLDSAVFYEVYPQSFYDTNADGIGDLPGVIEKLPYIESLGCNAIWLNPCFDSPFRDAGYDVRDFYTIAPRYGTNADLRKLCAAARKRGIRVVLDLVAGHTSIEHPWFKESCKAKQNKYSNWYIWTTEGAPKIDPSLSAIKGYAERPGHFIANFFYFQPALNYGFAKPEPGKKWQLPVDHPDVLAVRAELRKIMAFWLDQGVSGFRVDMASSLIKHDKGFKATIALWREERAWIEKNYPEAVLISEWSMPRKAIAAGFHIDFMIHLYYDKTPPYTCLFRHHLGEAGVPVGPSVFAREGIGCGKTFLEEFNVEYRGTRGKGYVSLPTGNHDIARIRKTRDMEDLKVIYAFLFTMPGVPVIYYGDEIGMRHIEGLVSKEGAYSRTGARTPMQWSGGRNAGFSEAKSSDLYLPIDPGKDRPTVAAQERDPDSLLNFVRQMLALRKAHPAFQAEGKFTPVASSKNQSAFGYLRQRGREKFLVLMNPSDRPASLKVSRKNVRALKGQISGAPANSETTGSSITIDLAPVSHAIFRC
jgi:glycosidase